MNAKETTILAKSASKSKGGPVTLSEHTNHLLEAFEYLRAQSLNDKLRAYIRLAIHCHDLGKALPAFQIRTLGNKLYLPFDVSHNIPHSLVSVLLVNQDALKNKIKEVNGDHDGSAKQFILSAVAYHHWRDNFADLIQVYDTEFRLLCEKMLNNKHDFTEALVRNLARESKSINGFDEALLRFNAEMAEGILNGVAFANYAIPPYQLYWLPRRAQMPEQRTKEWILISGFLMRCDHYASFYEKEGGELSAIDMPIVEFNSVKTNIKNRIEQQDERKVWQLQVCTDRKNKNTILIAPTGFGKTEFAFLWGSDQKLFYSLPLCSAVNQIFDRARSIFSANSVGLLHSDADVYLLGDGGESEQLKLYDLARQLSNPVIVSTGDQFFPYALRPPGYEKIYATFSYSKLVIDEVQAYDPRAAAIIIKFMRDIDRMGGKFLLMTATLPNFVRQQIHVDVDELNIYKEKETQLSGLVKNKIELRLLDKKSVENKPSFELGDEELTPVIKEATKNGGQRVLVILNTVRQAQSVYSKLKKMVDESDNKLLSNNIWLLHSRFTLSDRRDREVKMCGDRKTSTKGEFQNPKPQDERVPKILVATQVVEASLDLDADVLFTELAPMDALVQRMGRVLRRIRMTDEGDIIESRGIGKEEESISHGKSYTHPEPNVFVWVFKDGFESGNSHVYERELLGITLKLLSMTSEGTNEATPEDLLSKLQTWIGDTDWKEITIGDNAFDMEIESKGRKGRSTKMQSKEKATDKSLTIPAGSFPISEFEKYKLVAVLYQALSPNGEYLKKFYETLDILEAGYMSDRREDAHRIFREISSLSVIPLGKDEDSTKKALKEDILQFFSKNKDKEHLYTRFKNQILAKYVVCIPMNARKFQRVSRYLPELWVEEFADEQQRAQLARWLRGIYFVGYEYRQTEGITCEGTSDANDHVFL